MNVSNNLQALQQLFSSPEVTEAAGKTSAAGVTESGGGRGSGDAEHGGQYGGCSGARLGREDG